MTQATNDVLQDTPAAAATAPAPRPATRPLYWSVRREIWENRAVYVAPLVAAAVFVFGFLISTIRLPAKMHHVAMLDPHNLHQLLAAPFDVIAGMVVATAFLVGVFYSLDALQGERRDRSLLFWKSLPVSDRTTVLAKACIPLVVLPAVVFAIVMVTRVLMLAWSTIVLLGNAPAIVALWDQVKFVESSLALLYALVVLALWHAPIYGWLLLASAWAKRAAILWATLPLLAICAFEGIAFRSAHFAALLGDRVIGGYERAVGLHALGGAGGNPLSIITPVRFVISPGLWAGLVLAAVFLVAAMRLRRVRESN